MKKGDFMKKKLFLIIVVLLLTGCNANYKLVVDKDFNIKENVNVEVSKKLFDIKDVDIDTVLSDQITEFNKKISIPVDNYTLKKGTNNIDININNKYDSIESYNQSSILKNVNGKVELYDYTRDDGNNADVFQIMINYDFFNLVKTRNLTNHKLDSLNLVVEFPYEIISTNADKVEKNVLTWDLTKLVKSRSFYIEYNKDKLYRDNTALILLIVGCVIAISILIVVIFRRKSNDKNNI